MRMGLRLGWAAWIALAVPAVAPAQGIGPGDGSAPESAAAPQRTRGGTYIHDLVGPGALVGVGLGAGYAQWRTDPPEWGTGAGGYGKRAASTAGEQRERRSQPRVCIRVLIPAFACLVIRRGCLWCK